MTDQIDTAGATDRIEELERRVAELTERLELTTRRPQESEPAAPATGSRRQILKLAAGAAVGGAAVALGGSSGQVAAADGDPLLIGDEVQLAQTPTELAGEVGNFTGRHVLLVNDETSFGVANSGAPAAFGAWSQSRHGAYLWTNASATEQSALYAFAVSGTGVTARGSHAALRLVGAGGPPLADAVAHNQGEVRFDTDENLWVCVESGTPGAWVKLAGPATAGAFHAVGPVRAYDSRQAAYPSNGPLAPNSTRVVSVADGHDDAGAVDAADVVPEGARAVTFNLTATGNTGPNFLSVAAGDATDTATSTVNWSTAGTSIANASISPLDDSRQLKVFCGDQTGSTQFIIDITGYYL